jgi:small subunit ribosomal protein S16
MSVRLRLRRMGNTHRPVYRVTAIDQRKATDGRFIEELGHFNPSITDESKQATLKLDRCAYWLSVGAVPSDTVATLLKRAGLTAKAGTSVEAQPAELLAAAAAAPAATAETPAAEAAAE